MPRAISRIGAWVLILGTLLLIVLFFVSYRAVQTQRHLHAVQSELVDAKHKAAQANDQVANLTKRAADLTSELDSAKRAADKAKADASDLKKQVASLSAERDQATTQGSQLQTKLDQANSEITKLTSELQQAKATCKHK